TPNRLGNMRGSLGVHGGGGLDAVAVNDQANVAATTYTFNSSSQLISTSAAPITFALFESATLRGGSAADTYNVGPLLTPLSLVGGAASDHVNVQANALLQANVSIDGAGGADFVAVNNTAAQPLPLAYPAT